MARSRLTKRLQRQVIKSLFLSLLGIVIIVAVLIKFGIPILVNFSLFISGANSNQESKTFDKTTFVPIPILDTYETATNSASVQINGSSLPNHTIILYVNGNIADKILTDSNGNFSSIITLSPDKNIIKVKAITPEGKESDFSEDLTIIFKNTPPTLNISSPFDGQTFYKDQNIVEVKGKTDPQVRVTVNGFWAIIDEDNDFSYTLTLKEGTNEIKIVAQDLAGNKTEKILTVAYSP